MRRRRKIGRAYDMALEISGVLPRNIDLLDVGCGNGFIAHHLTGLLNANVTGIDVSETTSAQIKYLMFDGLHFPLPANSFDALLLCYVLHHAASMDQLLAEIRRVLREGGLAIIYEDMPRSWWDRSVCWTHDRQWRSRSGPCTFHCDEEWQDVFKQSGFEVLTQRPLSRWRNLAHPVARHFYVLKVDRAAAVAIPVAA
jgi:ubiquinone/menaquinone biosynthesis C-methylase UbiE